MKPATRWTSLFAALRVVSPTILSRGNDGLQVQTSSGLVNGITNSIYPDVRQFLGVPFAQPPVNELRFLPPQSLSGPSKEPIDATQSPYACPQYATSIRSVYNTDAPEFDIDISTSEDCLTLTVWTPTPEKCQQNTESDKQGLPVFIWIYGGGFQTGGTETPYQIPLEWIQRTQSHIVVSIQYRLNIFGYPNAAGLNASNPGLLDQRMAIEWIQKNIAAFGGDPERTVVWGQSAGAFSADHITFAYPSDPIVKGQICDSGSASLLALQGSSSTVNPHTNFSFVASQVDCPSVNTGASPEDELACMRTVPVDRIENFLKQYNDAGIRPSLSFIPVADNRTVFANYTERYAEGPGKGVSPIPAIFGTNRDEGRSLVAYPDPPTNSPNLTAAEQETLSFLLCPAVMSTSERTQAGLKTYRYLYEGNFTDVSPRYWLGAYHSSELPQVFGTRGEFRGPASPYELDVSTQMQDLWLNFARDPETAQGWPDTGATGDLNVFAKGSPDGGQAVTTMNVADIDAPCANAGSS